MSDQIPSIDTGGEVPHERPEEGAGEPEVPDQPLGAPADLDPEDAPLPGLPESEPPAAG
jgi:hypothetical protein